MTRTTCYSPFVEQDWGLTGEEAGLREGLEEGESDVDADPVPQLRQSIMSSDSSGIGNSRILAKSVPIVNSMVGGLGGVWGRGRVFGGMAGCLETLQGGVVGGTCLHGRWAGVWSLC